MSILDLPVLSRIRRNHGLEHATLTVLARRFPGRRMAGYSFPGGFFILGNVATEDVRKGALIALTRLRNGERRLAIHPNCGTNLVTAGFLAGGLAWLGMAGARERREKVERLPLVIALAMVGLVASQPLGPLLQERITTSGEPQDLAIADVYPISFGGLRLHRVVTQG
jgi:hypothetical protein